MSAPVVAESHNVKKIHPHPRLHDIKLNPKPHVKDHAAYTELYEESIAKPDQFWSRMAKETLSWDKDFKTVMHGDFEHGDVSWFAEGELNACYNCVDRHAIAKPDSVAIIYEADEPGEGRNITYGELLREVCKVANVLKDMGVKKGDVVTIYMPMVPEVVIAFMAIVRLGAVHSVVFAGFSSDSLRDRIQNGKSRFVITSDEGKRGGKNISTKKIVDDALKSCEDVKHCLVFKRTGSEVPWTKGRDYWWDEEVKKAKPYCPYVPVSAEDPLFLLYTSGSTGAPKGVLHTTAGYLLGAAMTLKYIFDVHPDDKIGTAGDVGWITGHTYVVYAPLLLGVATLVFEGTPAYPTFSRYWDVVEKHKITHWYVAPTAIRLLKRAGDEHVKGDLSSLRMLGSVGEPIAPEVFQWYSSVVGKDQCSVVDTYWQTETGSHVIAPLSGAIATKPGSASLPFFGIDLALVDPTSGKEVEGNDVEGVLVIKRPWPSMARTVYGAHDRYMDTYLKPYPGYYFTGDGAGRDHEGYYWIRGRVDDVVNVSGHRLSTAEIEAALIQYNGVGESAVVGFPHELTGQAIAAFVSLKTGIEPSPQLKKDLILQVRKSIGPFAAPSVVHFTDLPKTRSGKIMRRILRKIMAGEADSLGDLSTLAEPAVVEDIIKTVEEAKTSK